MKYIAIVGLDYRDCKAKMESLPTPKNPTKYTLVTKSKHLSGIPFSGIIETENAKQNPNYKEINMKLSGKPLVVFEEDKNQLKIDFEVKETPVKEEELTSEPEVEEMPEVPFSEEENLPVDGGEDLPNPDMLEPDVEETPEPENETYEEDDGTLPPDDEPSEIKLGEELGFDPQSEAEIDNGNEYIPEGEEVTITESEEEPEVEEEVVPETAPEEEEKEIKPVNSPRGWHARNEFIDDAGNIFHKGKYVGKEGIDE